MRAALLGMQVLPADGERVRRLDCARDERRGKAQRDVDGALVGGASLTAADFVPIIEAAATGTR